MASRCVWHILLRGYAQYFILNLLQVAFPLLSSWQLASDRSGLALDCVNNPSFYSEKLSKRRQLPGNCPPLPLTQLLIRKSPQHLVTDICLAL